MSTSSKKLSLQRETLRTLTADTLEGVLGGILGGGVGGLAVGSAHVNDTVYRPKTNERPHDTVYRPGGQPRGQNDTVYRGH